MRTLFCFCVVFLLCIGPALAQYSICGSVFVNDKKQPGITVTILETKDSVNTTANGNFCFSGLSAGTYSLFAHFDTGTSPVVNVRLYEDVLNLKLVIKPVQVLDTVQIAGMKRSEIMGLHSIKTDVIDLDAASRSAQSVEQLMNRAAGIRIRNSGGLGAEADVVVGGFSGKSIKILRDGIPIDYLGTSMGPTRLATGMADYIEVYKGVMPTEVGIDALGGAINIISKKPVTTKQTVSYEIGSFNTHRLGINSFIKKSEKVSYGLNAFFDYSANNFKVGHLPLVDPATGRTNFITAPLFHNAYRQYSGEVFLNLEKRKWADLITFKVNSYDLKRDIQNDAASRSRAFGGVLRKEHAYLVPSVTYKKSLLDNKLQLSQFLVYSQIDHQLADTVKNARYDWTGNRHQAVSGSEMGVDLSNLERPVVETRLNNLTYHGLFHYKITNRQQLILNIVNNYFTRESDNLNAYHSKTYITYNRFIAGLGYQYSLFENRFEGLSQVKYLNSHTSGVLADFTTGETVTPVQNKGWSFAQSFKYRFYSGWLLRASIENTYRLPDQAEIFGDNTFILPNLALHPEKSLNINFSVRYKRQEKYSIEVSTYYRNVKDLIRLKDVTQFSSVFLNLDKVRGYGLELDGWIRLFKQLTVFGNLTYNDFRFKGSNANVANNDHFINARVSNMPFYFGNAKASYQLEKFPVKNATLQFYWAYTYVHQFYLDFIEKQYEPGGFLGLFGKSKVYTNRIIPVQQVHALGFVSTFLLKNKKRLSLSFELNDLFDSPIYNTFKMQSAGRSFFVKTTFEF